MANVTFFLHESKAKHETPLFMMFRSGKLRVKMSTGYKILPSEWNPEKGIVRKSNALSENINNDLVAMKNVAMKAYSDLKQLRKREPLMAELRDEVKSRLVKEALIKKPVKINSDFYKFVEEFILNAPQRIANRKTGKKVTAGTIRIYKRVYALLKLYKHDLEFNDINGKFFNSFVQFLSKTRTEIEVRKGKEREVTKQPMTANNIGKIIKTLKIFMREAEEQGLHDNKSWRKFAVFREETFAIYVTETELEQIEALDLRDNPKLDVVRDLFSFQSRCALRVSDLISLTVSNIKGNFLHVITKKTGETVIIDIDEKMRAIINKHRSDNNLLLLPKLSEQKYNDALKLLGRLIPSMHKIESYTLTRGGETVTENKPRYSLLTTHTARRTGATHLYKMGNDIFDIMAITGHKDIEVFKKYIRISKQESAERIREQKLSALKKVV